MSASASLTGLFATDILHASLAAEPGWASLGADLVSAAKSLAKEDGAGRAWCKANGYDGYTSYASLDHLTRRATCFEELARRLQPHANRFADQLQMDLGGKRLKLDSLWVNILNPGGSHSGHIHPHSVLSGTGYLSVPDGASAIRFEDPRLPQMMAAPLPRADADPPRRRFIHVTPKAGDILLWESWLRHEVPTNRAASPRISLSFNYRR
jgi:uncharacterized protein (TIGR02466 family)